MGEAQVGDDIWGKRSWFKGHDFGWIDGLVVVEDSGVEWSKVGLVIVEWQVIQKESSKVSSSWCWLIEWIVHDDIIISSHLGGNMLPESSKLVLDAQVIVVESSLKSHALWRSVKFGEAKLLTVFNQRISIGIISQVIIIDRLAESSCLINWGEHPIKTGIKAILSLVKNLLGVEVWHTFTTNFSGKDVLMGVDHSVDALRAKSVDKLCDLVEVGIVVDSWGSFNGLPHDTESDEVESPILKILDVLIIE